MNNANYAWIQHFIYHLAPTGVAGFVLAKGPLTSKTNNEGEIRKNIIDADLIDCIVNLPPKLFLNTQIPACLWFLSRSKANGHASTSGTVSQSNCSAPGFRNRMNEIFFIDARNLGYLINRKTKEFSDEDIEKIAGTYHVWRTSTKLGSQDQGGYKDIPGFCKSVEISDVEKMDYALTPGRYIGLPEEEDDFDFEERFTKLKTELTEQMKEEVRLNELIMANLAKLEIKDK